MHSYLRNYLFLFLSFAAWSMFSCEEPFDVQIDEEAQLVVTSYFSENQDLVVYVGESRPVTSNERFTYVKNASVSVFKDNVFLERLSFVPDGEIPYYKTIELSPKSGDEFTINVNVPGYDPITATNRIPMPVPIENVEFDNSIVDKEDVKEVSFDVKIIIFDPAEFENFYHIWFYQELIPYHIDANGDTVMTALTEQVDMDIEATNDDYPLIQYLNSASFLLNDKTFNGLKFSPTFVGHYDFDPEKYIPGRFLIELRSVSKAYYDYQLFINALGNPSDPFVNDGLILDNIKGGTGIFAGFSSDIVPFSISN